MNKKSKITLFVLAVVSVLLVVMIAVSASPNRDFGGIYKVFGTPVVLVQKGMKKVSNGISGWFRYAFSYGEVQAELEELREYNAQIPLLEDENERILLENEELRKMLNFRDYSEDYRLVAAEIVAEDVTDWFNTFTISVGSADGIRRNDTVITPAGLVGTVSEVGLTSSKIITVVDENNAFMCRISRTNQLVRVRGVSGENMIYELRIDRVSSSTLLTGDRVVTADSAGVFPSGIMVGTVKEVHTDPKTGVITAGVEPSVDLTLLSKVYVMTENLPEEK